MTVQNGPGLRHGAFGNLHDRAEFLREALSHRILLIEREVEPAMRGKRHLEQRHEQAAVGAVVIGKHKIEIFELAHRLEQRTQQLRVVEIGRLPSASLEHLRPARSAEAVFPGAEIDQQQPRGTGEIEFGRERAPGVRNRRERGDHQRDRRDDRALAALVGPLRAHGKRILAHRNGDAELGAEIDPHRLDGGIQVGILTRLTAGRHPIRGEPDIGERTHVRCDDVGDGLAHREAAGGRRIEQRHRRALAHGHGFAGISVEIAQAHRDIRHGHLPGTDHLVAAHQSAHRPIADGDQERFVRDRGQAQQPLQGFGDAEAVGR